MTEVSQEAREAEVTVTHADIEAVRHFYNSSSANLTGQELVELEQAFARHRQSAERGEAWRPIETAPRDEPILAAIKVHHRNGDTWWERHVIVIDSETGTISDMDYHHGWEADDYQAWQPLPTPPEAVRTPIEGTSHAD